MKEEIEVGDMVEIICGCNQCQDVQGEPFTVLSKHDDVCILDTDKIESKKFTRHLKLIKKGSIMKEYQGLKVPDGDILEAIERMQSQGVGCKHVMRCSLARPTCRRCIFSDPIKQSAYIQTHLVPLDQIIVPFGMLRKGLQSELRVIDNGKNIQALTAVGWINRESPPFIPQIPYRLDPEWKPEDPAQKEINEALATLKEHKFSGCISDGVVKG